MAQSIFWYDFETTGTDPILDRAIQFAGIRTDLDLNVVEAPVNLLSMPGNDCVPAPGAIRVTGIRYGDLRARGMNEVDFTAAINQLFMTPETCVAGYNSIRFDDEFMRQMLYRNFFEPYVREWQGGNSRWDVIDMVRMAYALRPDGVTWPMNDDGVPSFRLELLTAANGIGHENAHDAVADVEATIAMVKLVRQAQPRLYDYLFNLRNKKEVLNQLYPLRKQAVVHVSSMYPSSRGCAAVVLPICSHPTNSNGVLCFDLSEDPSVLMEADAATIRRLVFSRREDLAEGEVRIPLKTIHINRCPAVAVLKTLSEGRAAELGIDLDACEANRVKLQQAPGLVEKVTDAFRENSFSSNADPDFQLYGGGFLSGADTSLMAEVRQAPPAELPSFAGRFEDPRMNEILFRFRARNFESSLTPDEAADWLDFRRDRCTDRIAQNLAEIAAMPEEERELPEMIDLESYLTNLESTLSSGSSTSLLH